MNQQSAFKPKPVSSTHMQVVVRQKGELKTFYRTCNCLQAFSYFLKVTPCSGQPFYVGETTGKLVLLKMKPTQK